MNVEDLYGRPQCITVGREQTEINETNFHRLAPRARDLFAVTGYRMSWREYMFGSFAVRNRERAYSGLLSRVHCALNAKLKQDAFAGLADCYTLDLLLRRMGLTEDQTSTVYSDLLNDEAQDCLPD